MDQRKTVRAILLIVDRVRNACLAGGPGPEVALPVGRFPPDMQVRVRVTVSTDGGQSEVTTVTFTARGVF